MPTPAFEAMNRPMIAAVAYARRGVNALIASPIAA